jgi:hypothetical protein
VPQSLQQDVTFVQSHFDLEKLVHRAVFVKAGTSPT